MQVGIDSFAAAFDENSRAVNPAERLRQLVQQIEHADEVGTIAFPIAHIGGMVYLASALAADIPVLMVPKVDADDLSAGQHLLRQAAAQVARSARKVQDSHSGLGVQQLHCPRAPDRLAA